MQCGQLLAALYDSAPPECPTRAIEVRVAGFPAVQVSVLHQADVTNLVRLLSATPATDKFALAVRAVVYYNTHQRTSRLTGDAGAAGEQALGASSNPSAEESVQAPSFLHVGEYNWVVALPP
jgi:hypothetical protein